MQWRICFIQSNLESKKKSARKPRHIDPGGMKYQMNGDIR